MNIHNIVNEIMTPIIPHTFHNAVDFAGGEPDIFAIYVVKETPCFFGDDGYGNMEHTVCVTVNTADINTELYNLVKSAFVQNGFTYNVGMDVIKADGYPLKKPYLMEFTINTEEEI